MQRALRGICGAVAAAAGIYGSHVAITYVQFGRPSGQAKGNQLLDQLMPEYEVRERHSVSVAAPAEITFAAARGISFHRSYPAPTPLSAESRGRRVDFLDRVDPGMCALTRNRRSSLLAKLRLKPTSIRAEGR
jgi:hypothetical protein